MYNHIEDCWYDINHAKSKEEIEKLFDNFPRWSGDWEIHVEGEDEGEPYYVVTNTYWEYGDMTFDDRAIELPVEEEDLE